jgi:hypothetical protein
MLDFSELYGSYEKLSYYMARFLNVNIEIDSENLSKTQLLIQEGIITFSSLYFWSVRVYSDITYSKFIM